MHRLHLHPLILALAVGGPALAQDGIETIGAISLGPSPAAELWFEARERAADAEDAGDGPFGPAIVQIRALGELFRLDVAWGPVDAFFCSADSPGTYAQLFDQRLRIPAPVLKEGAKAKQVQEAALELARTLDGLSEAWLAEQWPARAAALAKVHETLAGVLTPEIQSAALESIEKLLGIKAVRWTVPVRLVTRMPDPGGVALTLRGGRPTCIIGLQDRQTSTLVEVLLHEMMHALETQPSFPPSIPTALTRKLAEARVSQDELRNAPHTLYFLCAAELVRRHVDPEHVDYGESGYYADVAALSAIAKPLWKRWVAGEIERKELVDGIVAALAVSDDE